MLQPCRQGPLVNDVIQSCDHHHCISVDVQRSFHYVLHCDLSAIFFFCSDVNALSIGILMICMSGFYYGE